MANIGVVGLGNWGTALAQHLARSGHKVTGWAREPEVVAGIAKDHRNPLSLSEVELSPNLVATGDLNLVSDQDFVVLVVSSAALKPAISSLKLRTDSIFISAVKGLEANSLETPLQLAAHLLKPGTKTACLSGPSFARDVVADKPCSVVAASKDEATAQAVAELFAARSFRVYTSTDPLGVELGGVLKNVIALAAGVSDGLGLGDSARTAVITRGLHEITRLAVAMGAQERTLAGLSGLGDLVMTASSDLSRNRTVGVRLGRGEGLDSILKSLGSVAEGVRTAEIVEKLSTQYRVQMPISEYVLKLIRGSITPQQLITNLLSRPIKSEY